MGWFVGGRTVFLPKEGCDGSPDKFRPITCLNTLYKLVTGVALMPHAIECEILPEEQKALRKGRGCLEELMIDALVATEARREKRSVSVCWIDFQKAFDRVPHAWLLEMLRVIRAPEAVRRTVQLVTPQWRTRLEIPNPEKRVSHKVRFKRGPFQGDSLSPLLFCLCIAPVSTFLRGRPGYRRKAGSI